MKRGIDKKLLCIIMVLCIGTFVAAQSATTWNGFFWRTLPYEQKAAYIVGLYDALFHLAQAINAETGLDITWLKFYEYVYGAGDTVDQVIRSLDLFYAISDVHRQYPIYLVVFAYRYCLEDAYKRMRQQKY